MHREGRGERGEGKERVFVVSLVFLLLLLFVFLLMVPGSFVFYNLLCIPLIEIVSMGFPYMHMLTDF